MNQTLTYLSSAEAMLQAQILLGTPHPTQILWQPEPSNAFQQHLTKVTRDYPRLAKPEILKQAIMGFADRDYQEFMAKLQSAGITDIVPPNWTGDPSAFGAMGKVELDWNWLESGEISHYIPTGFKSAFQLEINPDSGVVIYQTPDTKHPLVKIRSKEGLDTLLLHVDEPLGAFDALKTFMNIKPDSLKPDPQYGAIIIPDISFTDTKENILNGMTHDGNYIYWSVVQTKWEMNKNGGHLCDVAVFTARKGINIVGNPYILRGPFIVMQYFAEYPIPVFVGSINGD